MEAALFLGDGEEEAGGGEAEFAVVGRGDLGEEADEGLDGGEADVGEEEGEEGGVLADGGEEVGGVGASHGGLRRGKNGKCTVQYHAKIANARCLFGFLRCAS